MSWMCQCIGEQRHYTLININWSIDQAGQRRLFQSGTHCTGHEPATTRGKATRQKALSWLG